jgi:hypothetical protein
VTNGTNCPACRHAGAAYLAVILREGRPLYLPTIKPISSHAAVSIRKTQTPTHLFGSSAIFGSFVAFVEGVAEEARTRGFAPPAFTGLALIEVWTLRWGSVLGLSTNAARRDLGTSGPAAADVERRGSSPRR